MPGHNRPTPTIEIDFINDPTSAVETWTNVTAYARVEGDTTPILVTSRGRDYELARVNTATFNLMLDNTDGRFDPSNFASPYATGVGNPGGVPGLIVPGRRLRVRATWLGVTYELFRGFVDSWPQEWSCAGFRGRANTEGTDGFAPLSQVTLPSLYVQEVLKDDPIALYRANDAGGTAGNFSTHTQPLSVITSHGSSTPVTTDTYAFGSDGGSGNLAGDPSPSLKLTPLASPPGSFNLSGYLLRTADLGVGPIIGTGTVLAAPGFTIELWFKTLLAWTNLGALFAQYDNSGTFQATVYFGNGTGGTTVGAPNFGVTDIYGNSPYVYSSTFVSDGLWHHLVCTLAADGKTPRMILDGVDQTAGVGAAVVSYATAAAWYPTLGNQWGAFTFGLAASGFLDGWLKNMALYRTPLSLARAQAHFAAGGGFLGDSTGVRQARILDAAGWPTGLRTLAAGDSLQGVQDVEGSKALEALQAVNDTEQGTLFQAPNGNIVQTARSDRYNLTPVAALGEAGTELHYQGDILVALDSREVYNDITVARVNGVTVRDQDSASQLRYFPRSLNVTSTAATDADAVYLSQWLLAKYKNPLLRVPSITLDPVTQPALWPIVLGHDIGTQVTVTRRPGPAPTISADFFIEKVSHEITPTSWKVTWLLSPAAVDQVTQIGGPGRVGGGTNLNTAATAGAATIVAVSSVGNGYSTTDPGYDLTVDAERMTVTAATVLSGGTQTLTVTRAVGGTVAAAHSAGAAITVVSLPLAF